MPFTEKDNSLFPLVSVVMCTYNGAKFLQSQLDSLFKQTYPNIEIIIADDASADGTQKILLENAAKDQRIVLHFHPQNVGFNKNFEHALQLITGSYISICDQDDIWHPSKIKRMMEAWPANAPLIYCNTLRFKEEPLNWDARLPKTYRRFKGDDPRKLSVFNTVSGHALMMRTSFLSKILPFEEKLFYDWWSAAVAACNGGVAYLPEALIYQRVHGANASMVKGCSYDDKAYKFIFNDSLLLFLNRCCTISNMENEHKIFFTTFSRLWLESMTKTFHFPLFVFLLKHRKLIFHYKNKPLVIFSHVKHSFRIASNIASS